MHVWVALDIAAIENETLVRIEHAQVHKIPMKEITIYNIWIKNAYMRILDTNSIQIWKLYY